MPPAYRVSESHELHGAFNYAARGSKYLTLSTLIYCYKKQLHLAAVNLTPILNHFTSADGPIRII